MDNVAAGGHLDTVKWLHENRTEGCSTLATEFAATIGHFDVIKWLQENCNASCTPKTIANAVKNGHFDIVLFLCAKYSEGCAPDAIHFEYSLLMNLEIAQWLHEKYPETVSVDRMREYDVGYMPAVLAHL